MHAHVCVHAHVYEIPAVVQVVQQLLYIIRDTGHWPNYAGSTEVCAPTDKH